MDTAKKFVNPKGDDVQMETALGIACGGYLTL
jgi:hypothetical protein